MAIKALELIWQMMKTRNQTGLAFTKLLLILRYFSASTEYEEIEVEVTDSEYDSESEPESEAVDFESAKSRLEDSHAHNLEEPTTKDSADSTSDSNSKPSIIYHPVENDALSGT